MPRQQTSDNGHLEGRLAILHPLCFTSSTLCAFKYLDLAPLPRIQRRGARRKKAAIRTHAAARYPSLLANHSAVHNNLAVRVPAHQPPVLRARHHIAAAGGGYERQRQAALRAAVALVNANNFARDVIPHSNATIKRGSCQIQRVDAESGGADGLPVVVHQGFEALAAHCVPQAAQAVVARRQDE